MQDFDGVSLLGQDLRKALIGLRRLLDIGPGIVRALFESKIRDAMLSVPQRLRSYVWKYVRPARPQPVATRALP